MSPDVAAAVSLTPLEKARRAGELQAAMKQWISAHPGEFPVLYEEGGSAEGEWTGTLHFADPGKARDEKDLDIVSIPTRCTESEVQAIAAKIRPYKETCEIFMGLLWGYVNHMMVMLEGGTSIGKTFCVNKLMEFLYGPGTTPLDFYCSGQTDTSQLMGKYVPSTSDPQADKKVFEFLESSEGRDYVDDLRKAGILTEHSALADIERLVRDKLGLPREDATFEFSFGAVPRAALADISENREIQILAEGGRGTMLHIQEIGLAKPEVVNALLLLRGEQGRIAESFQLWDDNGRTIAFGPDAFVCFSTNPTGGDFLERKEVDPALARNMIWVRLEELSDETITEASRDFLCYKVGNASEDQKRKAIIDLTKEPEICAVISDVVSAFHRNFAAGMRAGASGGDRQKIPVTLDALAQTAAYMLTSQVLSGGIIDFAETLRRAIDMFYVGRVRSEDMRNSYRGTLEELLSGPLSVPTGETKTRKEILDELAIKALYADEPFGDDGAELQGRKSADEFFSVFSESYHLLDHDSRKEFLEMMANTPEMKADSDLPERLWFSLETLQKPGNVTDEDWQEEKAEWKNILGVRITE